MKPEKLIYITKYNELTNEWVTFSVAAISYDGLEINSVSDPHIYRSVARCYKYLKIAERKRIKLLKDMIRKDFGGAESIQTPNHE